MRKDDCKVHDPIRFPLSNVWPEECQAVQDVQWQPAEGKEAHNDGQRLGSVDLLLQGGPGVAHQLHLPQLLAGHHEDLDVDAQHDEEGWEDTAKEVEVHHVAHSDHIFKKAFHQAALLQLGLRRVRLICGVGAMLSGCVPAVPSHQWRQADAKRQDPENGNETPGPFPCHQAVISASKRTRRERLSS